MFVRKRLHIDCSLSKSCKHGLTIQIGKELRLEIRHMQYIMEQ